MAAPSLVESARLFAGLMVRNTATVAGNIACGSPAADLVPPLLSLDADVTLASASASRTVPLDEYFLGYRRDVRARTSSSPASRGRAFPANAVNVFYKLARRKGDAITVTGVAVTIEARAACAPGRASRSAPSRPSCSARRRPRRGSRAAH